MNISYEGIGFLMVTFPDNGSMEGEVCKLTAEGNVEYCVANDRFCGVVHSVEKHMAAVQVEGFVRVRYSGTAPVLGYAKLVADGFGGVCTNTTGQDYLVVQVDATKKTVMIKL